MKEFTLNVCSWFIPMFNTFNRNFGTVRVWFVLLLISAPQITISMLKEIKKNHSCWQEDIYASGSQKVIVIFIIISFISINLSHYCRNCFNKLFFHWVYYEISMFRSFQSPIPCSWTTIMIYSTMQIKA